MDIRKLRNLPGFSVKYPGLLERRIQQTILLLKKHKMGNTTIPIKEEMYQDNIVAVKYVNGTRHYRSCGGMAGVQDYIAKPIKRVQYLKICWNCGSAYESNKYNSYACCAKCKQHIIYKLKRGIKPPARMDQHFKTKNIEKLKNLYGYL